MDKLIIHSTTFSPFHAVRRVLEARILECLASPSSSGSHFVRTLHCDPSSWVDLHSMALCFIELDKTLPHDQAVTHGEDVTEDEMVRWRHQLNGHEFGQTAENSEGQGSQASCSP